MKWNEPKQGNDGKTNFLFDRRIDRQTTVMFWGRYIIKHWYAKSVYVYIWGKGDESGWIVIEKEEKGILKWGLSAKKFIKSDPDHRRIRCMFPYTRYAHSFSFPFHSVHMIWSWTLNIIKFVCFEYRMELLFVTWAVRRVCTNWLTDSAGGFISYKQHKNIEKQRGSQKHKTENNRKEPNIELRTAVLFSIFSRKRIYQIQDNPKTENKKKSNDKSSSHISHSLSLVRSVSSSSSLNFFVLA